MIFKYSKERPMYINLLFFLVAFLGTFIMPSEFALTINKVVKNTQIATILGNALFIFLLYLMYKKDIDKEFKIFKDNFKSNFFNLFIAIIIKDVSANENIVREMLFKFPIYTMFSIAIIAPLSEELTFRKSMDPLLKNKWIYAFGCGLLFGACHLIAGEFKLINLLYLLPYGSLGFVFALMDRETKTTFTSIMMHMIHNTMTGALLLITFKLGAL